MRTINFEDLSQVARKEEIASRVTSDDLLRLDEAKKKEKYLRRVVEEIGRILEKSTQLTKPIELMGDETDKTKDIFPKNGESWNILTRSFKLRQVNDVATNFLKQAERAEKEVRKIKNELQTKKETERPIDLFLKSIIDKELGILLESEPVKKGGSYNLKELCSAGLTVRDLLKKIPHRKDYIATHQTIKENLWTIEEIALQCLEGPSIIKVPENNSKDLINYAIQYGKDALILCRIKVSALFLCRSDYAQKEDMRRNIIQASKSLEKSFEEIPKTVYVINDEVVRKFFLHTTTGRNFRITSSSSENTWGESGRYYFTAGRGVEDSVWTKDCIYMCEKCSFSFSKNLSFEKLMKDNN